MNTAALDFERPAALEAGRPPESRGVARDEVRLLVTGDGAHEHARFYELPRFLAPGTVLVVNRSATLAASLPAHGSPGAFRLNLSTAFGEGVWLAEPRWSAARPGPVPLLPGEEIRVADLSARVLASYPGIPRLRFVRIDGNVARAMARWGDSIRYGYLEPPFPSLAAYQTAFAEVPGSAEMPSAARPFTPRVIRALQEMGVVVAPITLHTGVSSLEIDAEHVEEHVLLPEPFAVPRETAEIVNAARADGRPVIAVGTTVVRALESAWSAGRVRPVTGFTRRFLRPGAGVHVVDGLITGFHDPRASHLALLSAVAELETVRDGYREAVREGYLWHEFGDSHLILPSAAKGRRSATSDRPEERPTSGRLAA